MGWWSYGIVDGDGPADCLYGLEDEVFQKAGITFDEESDEGHLELSEAEREKVKLVLMDQEYIKQLFDKIEDDIFDTMTTAWFVMVNGGMLSPFKQLVVEAIDQDQPGDWDDAEKRKAATDLFRQQVVDYKDGEAVELTATGLFDALFS